MPSGAIAGRRASDCSRAPSSPPRSRSRRSPSAHLERPSYWPDPAPDTSVTPGGRREGAEGPLARLGRHRQGPRRRARGLQGRRASRSPLALRLDPPRRDARASACAPACRSASSRPAQADNLRKLNRALRRSAASYHSIQAAVDDSGNNDRVVIMPGRYKEPKSRQAPVNDPACNPSLLQEDQSGAMTPSYEYQATCSNDQNLIYVQGAGRQGRPPARARPGPPRDPRAGARQVRPLQPSDRGLRRAPGGRAARRRQGL